MHGVIRSLVAATLLVGLAGIALGREGVPKGTVEGADIAAEGADIAAALFSIWLEPQPLDPNLKAAPLASR